MVPASPLLFLLPPDVALDLRRQLQELVVVPFPLFPLLLSLRPRLPRLRRRLRRRLRLLPGVLLRLFRLPLLLRLLLLLPGP